MEFCQIRKLFYACCFAHSDNVLAVGLSGKFSALKYQRNEARSEEVDRLFMSVFFCLFHLQCEG